MAAFNMGGQKTGRLQVLEFLDKQTFGNVLPSEIKTTTEALSFLQDSNYAAWLLGLVAAGFGAYTINMFLMPNTEDSERIKGYFYGESNFLAFDPFFRSV